MAVSPYKTFASGEVLTAADLNASFTQITDNGQDVPFPRTENADFDGFSIILDSDADSLIKCSTDDIMEFQVFGVSAFKFDGATDGGAIANGLTWQAARAASPPIMKAVGTDTNISIHLTPKGTGNVTINSDLSVTGAFTITSITYSTAFTFTQSADIASGDSLTVQGSAGNELTAASGTQNFIAVKPKINQSGTAAYNAILVDVTETATGSGAKNLLDLQVGASSKAKIDNAGLGTFTGGLAVTGNITVSGNVDGVDVSALNTTVSTAYQQGKETIWITAAAMRPTVSNGCAALAALETTAGRPDIVYLAFDQTSDEHAQFGVMLPKRYNGGTITFQASWSQNVGAVTTGVAWGLQGVAAADNETIDVAYGTPVVVTDDAQGAVEETYITDESAAVTIAGTPTGAKMLFFRIFRDVSDANDDLAGDAWLIGIKVFFTTNANTDT